MGEETWDPSIPRSKGHVEIESLPEWISAKRAIFPVTIAGHYARNPPLGKVQMTDGPRVIVCAECGVAVDDGKVFHIKPATYAVHYEGVEFYLERHVGVKCGCAQRLGLLK